MRYYRSIFRRSSGSVDERKTFDVGHDAGKGGTVNFWSGFVSNSGYAFMRKRKKNTKVRTAYGSTSIYFARHPLSCMDRASVKNALLECAMRQDGEFSNCLREVLDLLRTFYPPYLLATLVGSGLFIGVGAEGISPRPASSSIGQQHVEIIQALTITLPRKEWGDIPAKPHEVQKFIDLTVKMADSFAQRRFLVLKNDNSAEQLAILYLQECLRTKTQMIRNWGYFSHVVEISQELYGALDAPLLGQHGFNATDLIEIMRTLTGIFEARHAKWTTILQQIFRQRTVPELVRAYYDQYPGAEGDPIEFLAHLPTGITLEDVTCLLLAHACVALVEHGVVSVDELARGALRSHDIVCNVLTALSMSPGDLAGENIEQFFLSNPVWRAPGLHIGEDFFFPAPQVVFSHIHAVMGKLADEANCKELLERRRSEFLERKLIKIVKAALPGAKIKPGEKWSWLGTSYETDLIVIVDRVLMIFEAKSGALTPSGLRGGPDRVKRHVRELLVQPSEQSARLEAIIWKAKSGNAEAKAVVASLELDVENVESVIRVNVTLEDFANAGFTANALGDTGWIPKDLELAPTLSITDLQCVAQILYEQSFFVHYLSDRNRIEKKVCMLANEVDYLGLYLQTQFNLPDEYQFEIGSMSWPIDNYFESHDAGVCVPKPKPQIHPYFASLITKLEKRGMQGWTTIALAILRLGSFDEQNVIVKEMDKLRHEVPRNCHDPNHTCAVVFIPRREREAVVVFYVYTEELSPLVRAIVPRLVSDAVERSGRSRCIVVGRKIQDWQNAYNFSVAAEVS